MLRDKWLNIIRTKNWYQFVFVVVILCHGQGKIIEWVFFEFYSHYFVKTYFISLFDYILLHFYYSLFWKFFINFWKFYLKFCFFFFWIIKNWIRNFLDHPASQLFQAIIACRHGKHKDNLKGNWASEVVLLSKKYYWRRLIKDYWQASAEDRSAWCHAIRFLQCTACRRP